MANRFWVGGTGAWDASDTSHWASVTNGASGASAPTSADSVIFDGKSGGGTVTVAYNGTIVGMTNGAHTGTLDFGTSNFIFTSTVSISAAAAHTIKWGSGTLEFRGSLNISQTGTNLTLDVGTATIKLTSGGQWWGGLLIAHRLRIMAITGNASYVQINSGGGAGACDVNFLEFDTASGPVRFTLNNLTVNAKNNFHFAGNPNGAPICLRGVGGTGTLSVDAGKSGFIDWVHTHGMIFGSGITLRNVYDGLGNSGSFVHRPPQATAIGAL